MPRQLLIPACLAALGLLAACGNDHPSLSESGPEKTVSDAGPETFGAAPAPTPDTETPGSAAPRSAPSGLPDAEWQRLERLFVEKAEGDQVLEALFAIAERGTAAARLYPTLAALFGRTEDPEIAAAVLHAAAALRPEDCRDLLERGLKHDEDHVREAAAEAWGKSGLRVFVPLLEQARDEIVEDVQAACLRAVAARGGPSEVPLVLAAVDDLTDGAFRAAVPFLVAHAGAKGIEALRDEALRRPDDRLRALAAEGLGTLKAKDRDSLERLVGALEDDALAVRIAAVASLRALTGQRFDFEAGDPAEDRAATVASWKAWLAKQ